jgi:hypothetical protein
MQEKSNVVPGAIAGGYWRRANKVLAGSGSKRDIGVLRMKPVLNGLGIFEAASAAISAAA